MSLSAVNKEAGPEVIEEEEEEDFSTLTSPEISTAFKFFSKDKKHISKDDVKAQMEKYFPNLSLKDYKLLISGTQVGVHGLPGFKSQHTESNGKDGNEDEITEPQLEKLLAVNAKQPIKESEIQKRRALAELSDDAFMEAFQLFEPDEKGHIPEHILKFMITNFNTDKHKQTKVILRYDKNAILKEFDLDRDGGIGFTDFVHMLDNRTLK